MILVFIITFCVVVALGFGVAAAWSDYRQLTIPNIYIILIGVAFVPAFMTATIFAPDSFFFGSWKNHLFSLALLFLITYALFHFNLIGGGDSKLLSAFALWTGLQGLMPMLITMAIVGGLLGLVTLSFNKWKPIKKPIKNSWIAKAQKGSKELPYGIAIVAGALVAFWHVGYIQPNELMTFVMETTRS